MILNLLKGKNRIDQYHLDRLKRQLGDDPNILWYPSAGNDFKHIPTLISNRAQELNIDLAPDLFVHTDYDTRLTRLEGTMFYDGTMEVVIMRKHELTLFDENLYYIHQEYATFPEHAPPTPIIYLLDLMVYDINQKKHRISMLYFVFENINFLDKIILQHNIRISHLAKKLEGCIHGGRNRSISLAYAFLSAMQTQYLLLDNQENTDFEIIEQLKADHNLELFDYELTNYGIIPEWNGHNVVNVFKTSFNDTPLTNERLSETLSYIRETNRNLIQRIF